MATLASLKLVTAKKPSQQNPVVHRRVKLANKIHEQVLLATAHNEGSTYAPTRIKTVTNSDGDRVQVTQAKRIKPWWFVGDNGKVCIEIRYGSKVIEISKGKTAIEITSPAALIEALETVKTAVHAGELDAQIEAASAKLREGFGK
jgi:hypothetical protein